MSLIEALGAEEFFANYLLPLSRANQREGVAYFPRSYDASLATYWEDVATRTGGVARVAAADGDPEALLDQLGATWDAQGDERLARLVPQLKTLRAALAAGDPVAAEDEKVPDFVYPLF